MLLCGALDNGSRFVGGLRGLLLALQLSGVGAAVEHHGQTAGFGAGLFNAPGANVTHGAADGLPVQFALKHKRLGPSVGDAHPQAGNFAIPEKGLGLLVGATGQPFNDASRQIDPLGEVGGFAFLGSGHALIPC